MVFHRWLCSSWRQSFTASHLSYTKCTKIQYQTAVKVPGSFRLLVGRRHLHRHYNFAESLIETAPRLLHHSCAWELTPQGISLRSVTFLTFDIYDVKGVLTFLLESLCRHRARTVSSPACYPTGVQRTVSEETKILAGFLRFIFWEGFAISLIPSIVSRKISKSYFLAVSNEFSTKNGKFYLLDLLFT